MGVLAGSVLAGGSGLVQGSSNGKKPPNILLAIADDQSWPHTGAYGCQAVDTPGFDRIAREGVLFTNAFSAAPQCAPNRAAILTGRNIWQNEEAGTHASNFPKKFTVYTDILEEHGYELGYTSKGWAPGNWQYNGRPRNPAGPVFDMHELKSGDGDNMDVKNLDYAENFREFMLQRDPEKPFHFWYGCKEPHRSYKKGSGLEAGKTLEDVEVPSFLPDTKEVRSDLLDYMLEVEWFDKHLREMLEILEDEGELENTIVVVTSDNGMPFPRAKANLYEYGTHMPLAIRWPEKFAAGRKVDDITSSIDFAPTFLEAAGIPIPSDITGKSLWNILTGEKEGRIEFDREYVCTGRERHTHARPDNVGYPMRAIRDYQYLYINNIKPGRWPAGNPTGSGEPEGFHDVDSSPTKSYILDNRDTAEIHPYFELSFGKRRGEELYDITRDPGCTNNLIDDPAYDDVRDRLHKNLFATLEDQNDPRAFGYEVFDSYPRYSRMRDFKGFKKQGEYNLDF